MAKHEVQLVATEGVFKGLAKQNMLFHQCIGELIDNSIASKLPDQKFHIEIILENLDSPGMIGIYITDNGIGMCADVLKKALQLGGEPNKESDRLHEHGFGLKNSLATLTKGIHRWQIWSQAKGMPICSVSGPFGPLMTIEDDDKFPNNSYLPSDVSTVIYAETTLDYIRTVQGRGGPSNDLLKLRKWLLEHLGVYYRGYLEQDQKTLEPDGKIEISVRNDRLRVPPIRIPFANKTTHHFTVEIGGKEYKLEYEFGTLDQVKSATMVVDEKSQYYYLNNIPTQGIDIRLGKRVIATSVLESIWKTNDGTSQLNRHNEYNEFVGELRIPNVPRGYLSTTNNKTDFNLDDQDWKKIFDILNSDYRPEKKIRKKTEKALEEKWVEMLNATNPEEQINTQTSVWDSGTRIDVYREKDNGDIIIYEIKVGTATPIHLYQLIMYWDGLELNNKTPKQAILLVDDYDSKIEHMTNTINTKLKTLNGKSYNLKIEKHSDRGL